ncbi:hypothetical protein M8J77_015083 [Diaphorina citri]|nr:hypothetical protein M8J77_015083 [Diaphorina citri]
MALVLQKRAFNRSRNELVNSEKAIEAVKNGHLGDYNYEAVRFKCNYFSDRLKIYETRRNELKTAVSEDDLDNLIPKEGEELYKKLSSWLVEIEESLTRYQILRGKKTEDYEELLLAYVADEYVNPIEDPFPDVFVCEDEFTEETCDIAEEEELMLQDDINPDEISPSGIETGTECPDSMKTMTDDAPDESIVSDDSGIIGTNTPELESGETPLDSACDGYMRASVPDALKQPVLYGPLFDTPKFFGYLYFIFLRICLLLSMFKIFSSPKKLINVNVKRGKIFRFDAKVGSVYPYLKCHGSKPMSCQAIFQIGNFSCLMKQLPN